MKVKMNKYSIFAEAVCITLLVGVWIYLYLNWSGIPDQIPGHYNAMGEIDRMGSRSELLILPVAAWLMYLGITAVEHFPQMWNTGVTVTEENKERVYRILKNMITTVKLLVTAVFVYLTINSARSISLSVWFLPVFLILMFGSILYFIIQLMKAK